MKQQSMYTSSSIFILSDKLWFLYHHDSASLYMSSQSKHCDFHFLSHVLLTKWLSSIINVCPQLQTFRTFFLPCTYVCIYIFGWQFLNELNFQILSLSFLKTSSIKFFTFFLQNHCKSIVYLFGWEKLIWGREVSFIHIENTSFQSEYFPLF